MAIKNQFTLCLFGILAVVTLAVTGCSSGQCSNIPARPSEAEAKATTQIAMNDAEPSVENKKKSKTETVEVFKATGQKQCGEGTGISIESMRSTLEKKKISVFDSRTQDDGLMHMQLCGSPTGQIHVFSISKKDLKKAEALKFQKFVKSP